MLALILLFSAPAFATHGIPDHLEYYRQPEACHSHSNSPWSSQPVIAVVDAQGNLIWEDNETIITLDCVLPSTCTGKLLGNPSMRVTNGIANFNFAGLHLGGGAYGSGPVPNMVVMATSYPALPISPTYSAQFSECR